MQNKGLRDILCTVTATQKCTRCNLEKPLTAEFWHRSSKRADGFKPDCKPCRIAYNLADVRKRRDAVNAYYRERYKKVGQEKAQTYKERIAAGLVKGPDRTRFPEYKRRRREKERHDPKQIVTRRARYLVWYCLRLCKTPKGGKPWEKLVGYSAADLRDHIERQFLPGMSWANASDWHIDHIVPLTAFKYEASDDPEFRAAWALSNLRPLWASDNVRKQAKRTHLL